MTLQSLLTHTGAFLNVSRTPNMCTSPVSSPTRILQMTHLSTATGAKYLSMVSLLVGALVFAAPPALSQEAGDRVPNDHEQRTARESPGPNLPGWAEPSERPGNRQLGREGGIQNQSYSSLDGAMQTNQPELPGDPDQVPVDGGLALLAAAGAGYAVRRLREEEDEDEEPA